ncbi:MAG: hypothetical protein ACSLFD_11580 [Solirubrobacterales bacterium]
MRGLRIAGAIVAALGFAALALALLIFVVIYVFALVEGDRDTARWVFAVAATVFIALAALAGWLAKYCGLRAVRLMQN